MITLLLFCRTFVKFVCYCWYGYLKNCIWGSQSNVYEEFWGLVSRWRWIIFSGENVAGSKQMLRDIAFCLFYAGFCLTYFNTEATCSSDCWLTLIELQKAECETFVDSAISSVISVYMSLSIWKYGNYVNRKWMFWRNWHR